MAAASGTPSQIATGQASGATKRAAQAPCCQRQEGREKDLPFFLRLHEDLEQEVADDGGHEQGAEILEPAVFGQVFAGQV